MNDAFTEGFNEVRGTLPKPPVTMPEVQIESTLKKFENLTSKYEKQPPAPMSDILSSILSRNKMRPVQQ